MSNKITMFRGDSYDGEITVTDENGDAVILTNSLITMSAKLRGGTKEYDFRRRNKKAGGSSGQIEMSNPTNGKVKLHIIPNNTKNLDYGTYDYDVQVTIDSKTYTVIKDTLILKEDVTR